MSTAINLNKTAADIIRASMKEAAVLKDDPNLPGTMAELLFRFVDSIHSDTSMPETIQIRACVILQSLTMSLLSRPALAVIKERKLPDEPSYLDYLMALSGTFCHTFGVTHQPFSKRFIGDCIEQLKILLLPYSA